ncbi:hypothetical protein, partial [Methanosarcina acetivorans]|uniref:hypothetical protein n=1 Tax=Methanosarcina acetivorans TaxID=2214 RepID=UPI0024790E29
AEPQLCWHNSAGTTRPKHKILIKSIEILIKIIGFLPGSAVKIRQGAKNVFFCEKKAESQIKVSKNHAQKAQSGIQACSFAPAHYLYSAF